MILSIRVSYYDASVRGIAPTMNDPRGELTRHSFDERCRSV
jgi:hypothetical protein